jgi:hypothetical protein
MGWGDDIELNKMRKFLILYSGAIEILKHGELIGLEAAKMIFEVTKSELDSNDVIYKVIKNYLDEQISRFDAENILFEELIAKYRNQKNLNWKEINALIGSENVFKVFNHLKDDMPDKDYWVVLGECYIMSSFSHSSDEIIKSFFLSNRADRFCIMTEGEQLEFNSLPDEIEIYRGCSEQEIKSGNFRFSWTTQKRIAQFFAKRNKEIHGVKNSVISKRVRKEDVIAYFTRRDEFEIIYFQNN